MRVVKCEMKTDCARPVTHIGDKGFIYCAECAVIRRGYGRERTRKMRAWEMALIRSGKQLRSYEPGPKPPACKLAMGCLCAGHARGNPVGAACTATEV